MQIGKLEIDIPLALAPMAGITDLPYRVICREQGCGITFSEMVSAKGILYKNIKTFSMLQIEPRERPTAIQLFGSTPGELARAAKIIAQAGADVVDFNMGCPVHKIVANGEGSALMKTPQLAYEILSAMVDAVDIPVTVKIRAGWDESNLNAPEIAMLAEKAGVSAVAVHGRTREQLYSGKANWDIIREVKQSVKIPVFGNGDISNVADGLKMLAETGCDGIMIGRGADCNPWIFAELKAALLGKPLPKSVDIITRFTMIQRHLQDLIDFKGETRALKEMRRHVNMYLKGLPKSAAFRAKFNQMENHKDFSRLLLEYQRQLEIQ